jgi:curli biogenesis system outer membrane secretion channel CsgG
LYDSYSIQVVYLIKYAGAKMKHFICSGICLIFLTSCGSSSVAVKQITPVSFEKRIMIAVGDIQNHTDNRKYDSFMESLSGNLIYELQTTQCFRLIERQRLQSLLKEVNLSMTGLVDPTKTREVGRLLGVDAILFVNLASVNYSSKKSSTGFAKSETETIEVSMDARLVKVETGEILSASRSVTPYKNMFSSFAMMKNGEKADVDSAVVKCIDESVKTLVNDIAWQVSNNRIGSK